MSRKIKRTQKGARVFTGVRLQVMPTREQKGINLRMTAPNGDIFDIPMDPDTLKSFSESLQIAYMDSGNG